MHRYSVDYIFLCFGSVGFILSYSENIIPLKLTLWGVASFARFISLGHLDISRGFDENRHSKRESAEKTFNFNGLRYHNVALLEPSI